jgi:hypothetical protein
VDVALITSRLVELRKNEKDGIEPAKPKNRCPEFIFGVLIKTANVKSVLFISKTGVVAESSTPSKCKAAIPSCVSSITAPLFKLFVRKKVIQYSPKP